MSIFERAKNVGLPLGQYALFGSSLLEVWGIRHANDLDIIVSRELFEKLKQDKTWIDDSGPGYELLVKGEANVCTSGQTPPGNYNPDREQLVKEAVVINGVPFVRIEEVIACKKDYGRQKDLDDIAAIEKYLAGHPNPYELK